MKLYVVFVLVLFILIISYKIYYSKEAWGGHTSVSFGGVASAHAGKNQAGSYRVNRKPATNWWKYHSINYTNPLLNPWEYKLLDMWWKDSKLWEPDDHIVLGGPDGGYTHDYFRIEVGMLGARVFAWRRHHDDPEAAANIAAWGSAEDWVATGYEPSGFFGPTTLAGAWLPPIPTHSTIMEAGDHLAKSWQYRRFILTLTNKITNAASSCVNQIGCPPHTEQTEYFHNEDVVPQAYPWWKVSGQPTGSAKYDKIGGVRPNAQFDDIPADYAPAINQHARLDDYPPLGFPLIKTTCGNINNYAKGGGWVGWHATKKSWENYMIEDEDADVLDITERVNILAGMIARWDSQALNGTRRSIQQSSRWPVTDFEGEVPTTATTTTTTTSKNSWKLWEYSYASIANNICETECLKKTECNAFEIVYDDTRKVSNPKYMCALMTKKDYDLILYKLEINKDKDKDKDNKNNSTTLEKGTLYGKKCIFTNYFNKKGGCPTTTDLNLNTIFEDVKNNTKRKVIKRIKDWWLTPFEAGAGSGGGSSDDPHSVLRTPVVYTNYQPDIETFCNKSLYNYQKDVRDADRFIKGQLTQDNGVGEIQIVPSTLKNWCNNPIRKGDLPWLWRGRSERLYTFRNGSDNVQTWFKNKDSDFNIKDICRNECRDYGPCQQNLNSTDWNNQFYPDGFSKSNPNLVEPNSTSTRSWRLPLTVGGAEFMPTTTLHSPNVCCNNTNGELSNTTQPMSTRSSFEQVDCDNAQLYCRWSWEWGLSLSGHNIEKRLVLNKWSNKRTKIGEDDSKHSTEMLKTQNWTRVEKGVFTPGSTRVSPVIGALDGEDITELLKKTDKTTTTKDGEGQFNFRPEQAPFTPGSTRGVSPVIGVDDSEEITELLKKTDKTTTTKKGGGQFNFRAEQAPFLPACIDEYNKGRGDKHGCETIFKNLTYKNKELIAKICTGSTSKTAKVCKKTCHEKILKYDLDLDYQLQFNDKDCSYKSNSGIASTTLSRSAASTTPSRTAASTTPSRTAASTTLSSTAVRTTLSSTAASTTLSRSAAPSSKKTCGKCVYKL